MARTKRTACEHDPESPSKVRIVSHVHVPEPEPKLEVPSEFNLPHRKTDPESEIPDFFGDQGKEPWIKEFQAASGTQSGESQDQTEDGTAPQYFSQTPEGSGVELLGREVKKLITATSKLRDLGIEKFDLTLPKIVVVGDQSTGKSSLIEGISAIKVPRGDDTCTRCPLELVLQDSTTAWQCKITLVKKYTYSTGMEDFDRPHLGPWFDMQVPELTPFAEVEEKSELASWLRRAQLAVLNPQDDPEKFRTGFYTSDSTRVPFSPNFIRLHISGPGTPNLSFYDLPGVIVQDKQQYVPQLIHQLVRAYISASNCLILYAVPINNDRANSNTGRMIEDMRATARTLGVITKPDTLVRTGVAQWKRILEGISFRLGLGYFVVKNDPDPSVEHQAARERELEFFTTDQTFTQDLAQFSDRFGTPKLQDFLSRKLTLQIKAQLPSISSKIDERAKLIEEELSFLPKPPPENMIYTVQKKIADLSQYYSTHIEAISSKEDFFNVWNGKAQEIRDVMVQSYPDVKFGSGPAAMAPLSSPKTPRKPDSKASAALQDSIKRDTITLDDSSDEEEPASKSKAPPATQPSTPQKLPQNNTPTKAPKKLEVLPKNRELAKIFTLSEIKLRISAATRGFPGAFDPKVIEKMYSESTAHWQTVFTELMDFTQLICENFINEAHRDVFREFNETSLSAKILELSEGFLTTAMKRRKDILSNMLKMELGRPLTVNEDDFTTRKNNLEDEITERRVKFLINMRLREILNDRRRFNMEDKKTVELQVRNAPNPYKLETGAMASTRAYYECVAKRFSDYCATLVVKGLFEELRNDLPDVVCQELELNKTGANDKLRRLAEISREVAKKREQCEADLASLKQAKDYLEELLTNGTTTQELQEPGNRYNDRDADAMEE